MFYEKVRNIYVTQSSILSAFYPPFQSCLFLSLNLSLLFHMQSKTIDSLGQKCSTSQWILTSSHITWDYGFRVHASSFLSLWNLSVWIVRAHTTSTEKCFCTCLKANKCCISSDFCSCCFPKKFHLSKKSCLLPVYKW